MEETIENVRKSLGTFCNHLQKSCDALKQSVDRRPIPLDSSTSTFVRNLNKRVSSLADDLNLLENMSFGTVSFEELLGHCHQLYQSNQSVVLRVRSVLPPMQCDNDDEEEPRALHLPTTSMPILNRSTASAKGGDFDIDPPGEARDYVSTDFASLTFEDKGESDQTSRIYDKNQNEKIPPKGTFQFTEHGETDASTDTSIAPILEATKDAYDELPSSLKSLASWDELMMAVKKINAVLTKKGSTWENCLNQDEVTSSGLGPKARTYLLLLRRMNLLVIETIDGSICYRILKSNDVYN